MKSLRLLAAAAVLVPLISFAQADSAQCIVAGRLSADGGWAPRLNGVQLLTQDGKPVRSADRAALATVRQARLAQPSLLSRCDGDNELSRNDAEPAEAKRPAPALSAGLVEVESVSFPRLRTGGTLVELKVRHAPERVVMVSR